MPVSVGSRTDSLPGLEEADNEVGAERGATRSRQALAREADVRGRHCLLTTEGLIDVMRRASYRSSTNSSIVSPDSLTRERKVPLASDLWAGMTRRL